MFTRPIRRLIRSVQKLIQLLISVPQRIASAIATWFIRRAVRAKRGYRRSGQWSNAGFVLPTAVLLTLVVALTVGALTFRTFSRTSDVITERQQRVIQNAATPAIDRAKAKIEQLFSNDVRFPGGVPASDVLVSMMANDGQNGIPALDGTPYTFADETIVGDATDLTWQFTDEQGNTITYSILVDDENNGVTISGSDADKAANNVVRNGPISMEELGRNCDRADFSRDPEGGWYPVDTANVRRVFQVDAYVKDPNNNRVAALEFQQDRQASRGNKWGAWFRTDLEIFPGPNFMWNGAMHSEGSIIAKDKINAHLVSSPNSCVYSREASEITTAEYLNDPANPDFQGQFVNGVIGEDTFGNDNGVAKFHLFDPTTPGTGANSEFKPASDSIRQSTNGLVSQIALAEVPLFTQNISVSRGAGWDPADEWEGSDLNAKRLINSKTPIPFLDDTFRADNRYGPKPEYKDQNPASFNLIAMGEEIGNPITSRSDLTGNTGGDTAEFGLDGYWERRAAASGIRTIVGERLELGNAFGWQGADLDRNNDKIPDADANGDGVIDATYNGGFLPEPLYPSPNLLDGLDGSDDYSDDGNTDVIAQNRTLWDNLAAAQAMAVYRGGAVPLACVAVTSHPGTQRTILNSKTFYTAQFDSDGNFDPDTNVDFNSTQAGVQTAYNIDFLRGVGTNGWEFDFPYTDAQFATAYSSGPLRRALENLAHFAGDPNGGAPSFTPIQDDEVHPYPYMKMWGDFSMLRRILDEGTSYSSLSIADKSTLHTAACTLGMLAYTLELDRAANLDNAALEFFTNTELGNMSDIGNRILSLFDDQVSNGEIYANRNNKAVRTAINQGRGVNNDFEAGAGVTQVSGAVYLQNPAAVRTPQQWVDGGQDTVDNSGKVAGCTTDNLTTYDFACDAGDYYLTLGRKNPDGSPMYLTPDDIRRAAIADSGGGTGVVNGINNAFNALANFKVKLQRISSANQVLRDRTYGFKGVFPTTPDNDGIDSVFWDPATGRVQTVNGTQYITGCDPDIFSETFNGSPTASGLDPKATALAIAFCSQLDQISIPQPKYPALYYLFPVVEHDLDGDPATPMTVQIDNGASTVNFNLDHQQPAMEEYVADDYVQDVGAKDGLSDYMFQVVASVPDEAYGPGTDRASSFADIMIEPRARSAWQLPDSDNSTVVANAPNVILDNGTSVAVAFMDHNFYDGRELMNERMLTYDLGLLTAGGEGDFIRDDEEVNELGSIVYAFREDAVREDEIVRPMADDPDITASANRISSKAVDFEAEPDRRPHGFMLERGADLNRDNLAGMTFVSDNSVYIKGDFNLHSTDGTRNAIIEEFDEKMENVKLDNAGNYSTTFYGRENLNENFADPDEDNWRPVEILGDAVGFFSDVFDNDFNGQGRGSIEDAFNTSSPRRSYKAMRLPDFIAVPTANWYRERPGGRATPVISQPGVPIYKSDPLMLYFDKDDEAASGYIEQEGNETLIANDINLFPIMFNRNGYPLYCSGGFAANGTCAAELTAYGDADGNEFRSVTDDLRLNDLVDLAAADEIFVNATVVTGVVPSRSGQTYGGLHNLPRLVENWDNVDLNFSGAFFQLNFSTYATAPWDADPDTSNASFNFYGAPNRRWGYDVGLLYAPAGPVARRFVTLSSNRSEFYRELPSDDPYIERLK